MKLLTYNTIPKGIKGLPNRLISFRLDSDYTHSELMFEPGDNVDEYMPDKTCDSINETYWCISSSGTDRIHKTSPKRACELGGVRIKRIDAYSGKWEILDLNRDPLKAIQTFKKLEGNKYDWNLIIKYGLFIMKKRESSRVCSEFCGEALGYEQSWRIDPALLYYLELNNN